MVDGKERAMPQAARAAPAAQRSPQAVSGKAGIPIAVEQPDICPTCGALPCDWTETKFWQIVDGDGLAPVPSDMWDALERIARAARNRDMWKAQSERQASELERMRQRHDVYWRACGDVVLTPTRNGNGRFEQGWNACLAHLRRIANEAIRDAQGGEA